MPWQNYKGLLVPSGAPADDAGQKLKDNFEYLADNAGPQSNFSAVTDPTVSDDSSEGYSIGSQWINTVTGEHFICVDPTEGAAAWLGTWQANKSGDPRGSNATDLQRMRISDTQVASGNGSVICGGYGNTASGDYGTVSGGLSNEAIGSYSTIPGGNHNIANGGHNTIGGGFDNTTLDNYSTVAGGDGNHAYDNSAVCGGTNNLAGGYHSFIGGGVNNQALVDSSTVSGGAGNTASEYFASVGGGEMNTASARNSFVGGGQSNLANEVGSTIGGGYGNTSSGINGTIGGGDTNTASGTKSVIGGGYLNTASGLYSFVGGGYANIASGSYSTAMGSQAIATRFGQLAHSGGGLYENGDAQRSVFILRGATGDNTPTELSLNPMGSDYLTIPTDRAFSCLIQILAIEEGAANSMSFTRQCLIVNDGGTTALVGSVDTIGTDKGSAGWSISVTADNTHDRLAIMVTGATSTGIFWVATVYATEVKYA